MNAGAIIAGFGCRKGTAPGVLLALLRRAEGLAGVAAGRLALPAFRREAMAGAAFGLPLDWMEQAALLSVQELCPTRSAASLRATGLASVAEACALAASGPGGRLILPRIAADGATCALAQAHP